MIFRKKIVEPQKPEVTVLLANETHLKYVDEINDTIEKASKERGTGIARRTYEYIAGKISEGKAIIALDGGNLPDFAT